MELPVIDITYGEMDITCRNAGSNERCIKAVDEAVREADCAGLAEIALLNLTCKGQTLEGCGVNIKGTLLDSERNTLCKINTNAAELRKNAERADQ